MQGMAGGILSRSATKRKRASQDLKRQKLELFYYLA
jgi:hypothetical protein